MSGEKIVLGGIVDNKGNSYRTVVDEKLSVVSELGNNNAAVNAEQDAAHIYIVKSSKLLKIEKTTMQIVGEYNGVNESVPIASDEKFIYLASINVSFAVEKIDKSTMANVATSGSYGTSIFALTIDDNFVYIGGQNTIGKVFKLSKTDLSKVSESLNYGGAIRMLAVDEIHLYAVGETTKKIFKYDKSNLTKVAESVAFTDGFGDSNIPFVVKDGFIYLAFRLLPHCTVLRTSDLVEIYNIQYGGFVKSILIDESNIYLAGATTKRILIYDKNSFLLKKTSAELGTTLNGLVKDAKNIYCSSTTPNALFKLADTYQVQGYERVVLP